VTEEEEVTEKKKISGQRVKRESRVQTYYRMQKKEKVHCRE
jgi:hypothetical protein